MSILTVALTSLLFLTPLDSIEWVRDFDAGLEEALERGAPAFIYLSQDT